MKKKFVSVFSVQDAAHGGVDFVVIYQFVKNLENGTEPYWNVYRPTAAASAAILAWRSILNHNACCDVPGFRKEEDRKKYEYNNISSFPDKNGKVDIPCSSQPYAPDKEDMKSAQKIWGNADFLLS